MYLAICEDEDDDAAYAPVHYLEDKRYDPATQLESADWSDSSSSSLLSGLEALDDHTVRVTLAEPDAAFLTTIGMWAGFSVLPEHLLGEVPPEQLATALSSGSDGRPEMGRSSLHAD